MAGRFVASFAQSLLAGGFQSGLKVVAQRCGYFACWIDFACFLLGLKVQISYRFVALLELVLHCLA